MKEFSSSVRVNSLTMVEEKFGFKSFVMPQSEGCSFMNIYFEGQRKNIIRMMFIRIPYPKNYHENIRFITNIRKLRTMLLQPSPPLGPTYYRAILDITARHNLWQREFSPKNRLSYFFLLWSPNTRSEKSSGSFSLTRQTAD